MEQFIKELVKKYDGKTPYEKLALTEIQNTALSELVAAFKKCKDAGVAFVKTDYATYAYNSEDVYDMDCTYNDYSVCDIQLEKLQKVDADVNITELFNGLNECSVSFYSTTFVEEGEGILY